MNKIGFSVILSQHKSIHFYEDLLNAMLDSGCEAIEIHTPDHSKFAENRKIIDAIRHFSYRSIHASSLSSLIESRQELVYYRNLIELMSPEAITVHPHTMQSWAWLYELFGNRTSFENMDWRKPFGKSVEEMKKVFDDCPGARLTYDLNHVFTNDQTMQLSHEFYENFNNLGHYHLSGFKDDALPHAPLYIAEQDAIIAEVRTEHPIIIESFGTEDIQDFAKEYTYVIDRLKSKLRPCQ